jgi:hypothetical protein
MRVQKTHTVKFSDTWAGPGFVRLTTRDPARLGTGQTIEVNLTADEEAAFRRHSGYVVEKVEPGSQRRPEPGLTTPEGGIPEAIPPGSEKKTKKKTLKGGEK